MNEFEITFDEPSPEVTLVKIRGWLDAHTFELFDRALANLFQGEKKHILIDLSQVEYISSAGAGVFIGALTTAQETGGKIILMNPTKTAKEIFDLLGLSQIFQFVQSVPEALELFEN